VFSSSLKDKLQNSLVSYLKTNFFTFIKVEMANRTITFDLNEHMHDAFDFGDAHLEFGNLHED
jgi:hypothetical protein